MAAQGLQFVPQDGYIRLIHAEAPDLPNAPHVEVLAGVVVPDPAWRASSVVVIDTATDKVIESFPV